MVPLMVPTMQMMQARMQEMERKEERRARDARRLQRLLRRLGVSAGGPFGERVARVAPPWSVLRVLILLATLGYIVGYFLDYACIDGLWASPDRYEHLCYSDIPALFGYRGFADGFIPYLQTPPGGQPLEYPVVTGAFMWVSSLLATPLSGIAGSVPIVAFFNVNVIGLLVFLLVAVLATALTVRHRPWDAAMVALAPTMILGATINWDLIPIALTALAMLAWALAEKSTRLSSLLLRSNDIEDDGATELCAVVGQNTTITCLDLTGNHISCELFDSLDPRVRVDFQARMLM